MPASFRFSHSPEHGSVGCTIGLAPHVYVGAFGEDAADALHKASALASKLQATINAHPDIQKAVMLVPGASTAFAAISAASSALKHGHDLEQVARKVGPKVAHAVARILSIF